MKILWIIRGLPNSGKSEVADELAGVHSYAADDYFDELAISQKKSYAEVWTHTLLKEAHQQCLTRVGFAMAEDVDSIAVANSATTLEEIAPYLKLAETYGYRPYIIKVERGYHDGDNRHGVSPQKIRSMHQRYQTADPRLSESEFPTVAQDNRNRA